MEFHTKVLDDIPQLWEAWIRQREQNGDPQIKAPRCRAGYRADMEACAVGDADGVSCRR